ncbi:conserved hypothetical protein [Neospora caninum Liverpool]|uniref:Uncharacterized protein n=1 Tax=Neospora caninum (strain Liverpool) TaxID=572307 RepID=F0VFB0_NEOCL|nr:conserved hypothetical protein [Neospora caninum Liverpool]CBZ52404.1 conserved hypothetical protein [Neospora caninum Liverpool]CEL66376.1 TPA: hypothetical protein BN1204_021930 [Neospora caninum Liverpool]|eukprot:XP_003882436.1 conserved hypothetical protein [Neospora caninum Liverpool]
MRRSRTSTWVRDPDCVCSRAPGYRSPTRISSARASTRFSHCDSALMLDQDGEGETEGAALDANENPVVQYIPFGRTRTNGDHGVSHRLSSDEISRGGYLLPELRVPISDQKRPTSSILLPVDPIPLSASSHPVPLQTRRGSRNQTISVRVRPEWGKDKPRVYAEPESTSGFPPRKRVAHRISLPLSRDVFAGTDDGDDQIMYLPVRRSTTRQLRFCSVPVAPASLKSALRRFASRPHAAENPSDVHCRRVSRGDHGGGLASGRGTLVSAVPTAFGDASGWYTDDEACVFEHHPMRQGVLGRRSCHNLGALPACRASGVLRCDEEIGVLSGNQRIRERASIARRSTKGVSTMRRPSTNLVVRSRPGAVSRDVGDGDDYVPLDVSVGSTTASTAIYGTGDESSWATSRRFLGEGNYDNELQIPYVYVPAYVSSVCGNKSAVRGSLNHSPASGGVTGRKSVVSGTGAGQTCSAMRVSRPLFAARNSSVITSDANESEPEDEASVEYGPRLTTPGDSIRRSLRTHPSSASRTELATIPVAEDPLVFVEESSRAETTVPSKRVDSRLTTQLDAGMLTGRSIAVDGRAVSQVPSMRLQPHVSDEQLDDIVLIPVRRSVSRCEVDEPAEVQAGDSKHNDEEEFWEDGNQRVPAVNDSIVHVPVQYLSSDPPVTLADSRRPSSANTRRTSSVPAAVNGSSIPFGSASQLRHCSHAAGEDCEETGVENDFHSRRSFPSQLSCNTETGTFRRRRTCRKSSSECSSAKEPLATDAAQILKIFDDGKRFSSDVSPLSKAAPRRGLRAPEGHERPGSRASKRPSQRVPSQVFAARQSGCGQRRSSARSARDVRAVLPSSTSAGEAPQCHRGQLQGAELSEEEATFDYGESGVAERHRQTRVARRSTMRGAPPEAVGAVTGSSVVAAKDAEGPETLRFEADVEAEEDGEEEEDGQEEEDGEEESSETLVPRRSARLSRWERGRVTAGASAPLDQYRLRSSQTSGARKTMRFAPDGEGEGFLEQFRRKEGSRTAAMQGSLGGKLPNQETLFSDSDQEEPDEDGEGSLPPANADDFADGEVASTYDSMSSSQTAAEDDDEVIFVPLRRRTRRHTKSSTHRHDSSRVRGSGSLPSTGKGSSVCCRGFLCCGVPEVPAETQRPSPLRSLTAPPHQKDATEMKGKNPLRLSTTQKGRGQSGVIKEVAPRRLSSDRKTTLQLPAVQETQKLSKGKGGKAEGPPPASSCHALRFVHPHARVPAASQGPTIARRDTRNRGLSLQGGHKSFTTSRASRLPISAKGAPVKPDIRCRCVDTCVERSLYIVTKSMNPFVSSPDVRPGDIAELAWSLFGSSGRCSQVRCVFSVTASPELFVRSVATSPIPPVEDSFSQISSATSSADSQSTRNGMSGSSGLSTRTSQVNMLSRGTIHATPPRPRTAVSSPGDSSSTRLVSSINVSDPGSVRSSVTESLNTCRATDGFPRTKPETGSVLENCPLGAERARRPSPGCYSPMREPPSAPLKPPTAARASLPLADALESGDPCDASERRRFTGVEQEVDMREAAGCVRRSASLLLSAEAPSHASKVSSATCGPPPLRASVVPLLLERNPREEHESSRFAYKQEEGFSRVSRESSSNPVRATHTGCLGGIRSWGHLRKAGRAGFPLSSRSYHSSLISRYSRRFPVLGSAGTLCGCSTALSGASTARQPSSDYGFESRFSLSSCCIDRPTWRYHPADESLFAGATWAWAGGDPQDDSGAQWQPGGSRRNDERDHRSPANDAARENATRTRGRDNHSRCLSAQQWQPCGSGVTSVRGVAAEAVAASFCAAARAEGGYRGEPCLFPRSPSSRSSGRGAGTSTTRDAWSREGKTENRPYCEPAGGREARERNASAEEPECARGSIAADATVDNSLAIGVSGETQTKESGESVEERGKTECGWGHWWSSPKSRGSATRLDRCTHSLSPRRRFVGSTHSRVERPRSGVSRIASLVSSLGGQRSSPLSRGASFRSGAVKTSLKSAAAFWMRSDQTRSDGAPASQGPLNAWESLSSSVSALSVSSVPEACCVSDESSQAERRHLPVAEHIRLTAVRVCVVCVYVTRRSFPLPPDGAKRVAALAPPSSRSLDGFTLFLDRVKTRKQTPPHHPSATYNSSLRQTVQRALHNLRQRRANTSSSLRCSCDEADGSIGRDYRVYSGSSDCEECRTPKSTTVDLKGRHGGRANDGGERTSYISPLTAAGRNASDPPTPSASPSRSSASSPSSFCSCSSRTSDASSSSHVGMKGNSPTDSSAPARRDSDTDADGRRKDDEAEIVTAILHRLKEKKEICEEQSERNSTKRDSSESRGDTPERLQPGGSEHLPSQASTARREGALRKRSPSRESIPYDEGKNTVSEGESGRVPAAQQEGKFPLQVNRWPGDTSVCALAAARKLKQQRDMAAKDAVQADPPKASPTALRTKRHVLLRLVIEDCRSAPV